MKRQLQTSVNQLKGSSHYYANEIILKTGRQSTSESKVGFSNNVLILKHKQKNVILIPAYLRVKIEDITEMDVSSLKCGINCALSFRIFYGDLQQHMVDFLKDNIEIVLQRSQVLKLSQQVQKQKLSIKNLKKDKILSFRLVSILSARMQGNIFWSPFQVINIILTATIRSLKYNYVPQQNISQEQKEEFPLEREAYLFKFNLMDCKHIQSKIRFSYYIQFGLFRLADRLLEAEYTNHFSYSKSQHSKKGNKHYDKKVTLKKKQSFEQLDSMATLNKSYSHLSLNTGQYIPTEQQETLNRKDGKLRCYQYAHFVFPVYRKPFQSILSIYIPAILLAIINIGVFFQQTNQTGKVMLNLGAIMISYVQLIPITRESTTPSASLSITQIFLLMLASTTFMTFLNMLETKNVQNYEFYWTENGYALICVAVTLFVIVSVVVSIIVYKLKWKRSYHEMQGKIFLKRKQLLKNFNKFNRTEWRNPECDHYFLNAQGQQKIKIYQNEQRYFSQKYKESEYFNLSQSKLREEEQQYAKEEDFESQEQRAAD